MDHFSASCDSTASLFIFVRIGFEPCNILYLAAVTLLGPAIFFFFVARCCVCYHGYLSFDPFCSIVTFLRAMQCVKLRPFKVDVRFSHGCVFVIASLRSVTVRFVLRELRVFLLF